MFGMKRTEEDQLVKLAPEPAQPREYTQEEKLRYSNGRLREENRRLNTILLNEDRIQKEMEKRIEAEAELRIERKKFQGALNEQQNQLMQQKKQIVAVQRKSFENQLMNDFLYAAIKEAGLEFDFKAAREKAHEEAMAKEY